LTPLAPAPTLSRDDPDPSHLVDLAHERGGSLRLI
jgi:hypothetical protein